MRAMCAARAQMTLFDMKNLALAALSGIVLAGCGTSPQAASNPSPPNSGCLLPPGTCYTPGEFRNAYGISPLLEQGVDGRGQTVVMPEVEEQPGPDTTDIRQAMARFDSLFGLPGARLRVDNSLAGSASPWLASGEEVEDAEMVHAVAPAATITIVLAKRSAVNSPADFAAMLTAFLRLGAKLGGVLSISASIGEHYLSPADAAGIEAALQLDRDDHVTVVAASGDKGASSDMHFETSTPVKEVSMPASDPLVLAAGGTSLSADRASGAYIGETAWNTLPAPPAPDDGSSSSSGGFSHLFARPDYQSGVTGVDAKRGVPDVAGDAAFDTGMALADFAAGHAIVRPATGTSAAAPFWAGLVALADQLAHRHLGFVNPAIYQIARSADYHRALHDVTTGDNTFVFPPTTIAGYQASPGWDPVTGWGSPNAQVLVPLLAQDASG
jgi:subtilase family serine protease